MKFSFLILGILFGFLLSRAGATTYDNYAGMFLFQNYQLVLVIGVAVLVGILGNYLLGRGAFKALLTRESLVIDRKPLKKGLISGSLIFGVGWGISGSCPGTAPAMLGEGKLLALFVMLGIGLGTYWYGYRESARSGMPKK